MEFGIQKLRPENLLADSLLNPVNTLKREFELLNDILGKTLDLLLRVENLTEYRLENSSQIVPVLSDDIYQNRTENTVNGPSKGAYDYGTFDPNPVGNRNVNSAEASQFIDLFKGVSKLTENTLKTADAFEVLSPHLKNVKNGLSVINDLGESATGIGRILSAEDGLAATESILTAGEIMGGAAAIAESGAAFGPPGWLVGMSALSIGGIMASMSDSDERTGKTEDFSVDKWRRYYWEKERKKDYDKLVSLYKVTNYKQAADIETELDGDDFARDRADRVNRYLEQTPLILQWGGNKETQPSLPGIRKNISEVFFSKPKGDLFDAVETALEIDKMRKLALFDAMDGKINTKKLNHDIGELQNKNRTRTKSKKIRKDDWRLPTDDEWAKARDSQNRRQAGLPQLSPLNKPSLNFSRKSVDEHHLFAQRRSAQVINININKPMIENFTIKTISAKEGLNDFKHKVEEVLLEILNSANAIQ